MCFVNQARKLVTVPPNGQISIGKSWAGREVMVEVVDDNQIVITSGTFIPAHQQTFYTKEAQATLDQFNRWSAENSPKKTDLSKLKKDLGRQK